MPKYTQSPHLSLGNFIALLPVLGHNLAAFDQVDTTETFLDVDELHRLDVLTIATPPPQSKKLQTSQAKFRIDVFERSVDAFCGLKKFFNEMVVLGEKDVDGSLTGRDRSVFALERSVGSALRVDGV